jgi:hypothetical protein
MLAGARVELEVAAITPLNTSIDGDAIFRRRSAHNSAFSRRNAPEVYLNLGPPKNRGRRESRMRAAPAVSCAMCTKKCAHEHTGSAESIRPSLRNGFTAYSALSPVTGFLATVAMRIAPHDLTPASGRQNHTTSPSTSAALVSRSFASTASHRTFVTIASRPSCRVRRAKKCH